MVYFQTITNVKRGKNYGTWRRRECDSKLDFWDSKEKLVLTDDHLLIQQWKGIFRLTWNIEISFGENEDYGIMDTYTSLSSLTLKLRNKEQIHFNLTNWLLNTQHSKRYWNFNSHRSQGNYGQIFDCN